MYENETGRWQVDFYLFVGYPEHSSKRYSEKINQIGFSRLFPTFSCLELRWTIIFVKLIQLSPILLHIVLFWWIVSKFAECSILFITIRFCWILSISVWFGLILSNFVQLCPLSSKFAWFCSILFDFACRFRPVLFHFGELCPVMSNLFWFCSILSDSIQLCPVMSNFVCFIFNDGLFEKMSFFRRVKLKIRKFSLQLLGTLSYYTRTSLLENFLQKSSFNFPS